jgi:glycosyltransferase involved in cell wall biosynthesis
MAQKLIKRGHSVTMVCASYGAAKTGIDGPFHRGRREGTVDGIRVIELELPISNRDNLLKRTWTFLKYSLRSSWIALFTKCDLVFATSTPLTAAIPGLIASWLRWRPFVFEVRDLWPELPKAMGVIKNPIILLLMAILEKLAYRSSIRCIGLAPGIVDGIAKHISRDRIELIPNGCDLDLFDPKLVVPWRPDEFSSDDFVAVFAGTHGTANGLDAVLDAAKVLKGKGRKNIKLLLVGDGKNKDALVERAKVEELSNVVFLGSVRKDLVPGLLRGANVGMQILANVPAFYYGTSPNKFFDYLSAGLPVLNNYPGWVADMVVENDCGKAVPPEDPDSFADALCWLADHRDRTQGMGIAARSLAIREFDRDKLSDKFVDTLETAISVH